MALRNENYLFTSRIADRGSDEIVFDSQDRKIQETDPKDVIWDEIVGKEEHPEHCDGYKFLETNSEAFIRDENCGKEEYPGNCSVIYPSPPCFDEYGEEEWYSWFTGGDRNLPGDESGSKSHNVEGVTAVENSGVVVDIGGDAVTAGYDSVFTVTRATHNLDQEGSRVAHAEPETGAMATGYNTVATGDDTVAKGSKNCTVADGGVTLTGDDELGFESCPIVGGESQSIVAIGGEKNLEALSYRTSCKEDLNFESCTSLSPKNMTFQIGKDFKIVCIDKHATYDRIDLMPPMHEDDTRGNYNGHKAMHVERKLNGMSVELNEEKGFFMN